MRTTLAGARLQAQQLQAPSFTDAAALVRWMGAVQAQDYAGGLWGIGVRLRGRPALQAVEAAIAGRQIVRTWPMRGTLHFVPAADARWMLRLLTPRVVARSAARYRELQLDAATFARSARVLERALRGGGSLTRPQAYAALARGGVSPQGQRGIHILGHLAQQGLLVLGPRQGRQPTFVLLEEWVPPAPEPGAEEALAVLANRYFTSHGPAALQDFAWWAGLPLKEAQRAIDGARLRRLDDGGRTLWSASAGRRAAALPGTHLLPPWDEYLVAYKERGHGLGHLAGRREAATAIGKPLILIEDRVRGSWGRTIGPKGVQIRFDYWTKVTAAEREAVTEAARRYAAFLGRALRP